MPEDAPRPAQAAIRTDLGAIFVSMELSRRAWLVQHAIRSSKRAHTLDPNQRPEN
jgi:hypothetical protein